MLEILKLILSPIIWAMDVIFITFTNLTSSPGISVVLVSILVAALSFPLRKWAQHWEARIVGTKAEVDLRLKALPVTLKGEARFREVEKIYEELNYHPIKSIAQGLPFFIMLPFLLSALFLFADNSTINGEPFLFISDLSLPDGLIGGVNLLPFLMSFVTILDAHFRFSNDRSALVRFYVIAAILLMLVYGFSAALVLYWTTSNLISMITFLLFNRK